MVDCNAVRESIPDLITETLRGAEREDAHRHIEECEHCRAEWAEYREAWSAMGALREEAVPAGLRARFLAEAEKLAPRSNVVEFRPRPAWQKWAAQAAGVAVLVGGSFFAGRATEQSSFEAPATVQRVTEAPYSLAARQIIPAAAIQPQIQGNPEIRNVRFIEPTNGSDDVEVSFDITSNVTVTGKPEDKSLVNLLSYVIQNQDYPTVSKSNAMEWVKQTYSTRTADPELVKALANVLKNEPHEGVRIKAAETLRQMPPANAPEARLALIEALKNDPNPAVRIKAIDALANMARSGESFDPQTLDMLRQKAEQANENPYVRVKAAEALSQIDL